MAILALRFPTLGYLNVLPYFALMVLFLIEASLVQKLWPFYRRHSVRTTAGGRHFAELDGLRGVLALSVFFTHSETHLQRFQTGAWSLVDSNFYSQLAVAPVAMFFLITGFLFWSKALKGTLGTWNGYLKKRALRLFPAYLLAVVLIFTVVAVQTHFEPHQSLLSFLGSVLSFLTFQLVPGPPPNGFSETPLVYAAVFWSLRVEWMFYLSLLFLAYFARSIRKQVLLILIVVAAQFTLPIIQPRIHVKGFSSLGIGTLEYFTFYLYSYFSIGMIAAYLRSKWQASRLAKSSYAAIAALLVIACLVAFLPPKAGLLEGVILGLPFLAIVYGNSFWGFLRLRPVVLLGEISYSIYILHGIVLYVSYSLLARWVRVNEFTSLYFWGFTALTGSAVIALAAFSYRFFEAPFIGGGSHEKQFR
jgi:peptidoglycan/LPS O-acetylase OafA/YrhL